MDEASKLVFELQNKLAELDHKVWLYRRDMASEFTKHAESLLRDVPRDVSETVSKALARSMKEYKSLNLDPAGAVESCAAGTSSLEIGAEGERASQPTKPSVSTREEVVDESPGGPHDREKALQGLFTPSYLPLLDGTHHRGERKSSSDSQISLQLENKSKEMQMDNMQNAAGTDTRSLAASPEFQRPLGLKRRNTDEVSVASDWSSDGTRRSALRRASTSSNKQLTSPRRVRFEVEGEEVLPTASPLPSQLILSTDIPERSQSPSDDSDEEAGSEQIEDVDEPSPKRISSSQALRALSRNPVADDGTQWTTVTAPPDGSASVAVSGGISQDSSSENLPRTNGSSGLRIGDGYGLEEYSGRGEESSQQTSQSASQGRARSENYDSETSSDDDMLDMPPLRSMKGQKSTQPPTYTTKLENIQSPAVSKASDFPRTSKENLGKSTFNGGGAMRFTEEDDEQVFHFDENTNHRSPPKVEQDEPETSSPASPVAEESVAEPANLSQYSQSPARPIVRPGRVPTASDDVAGTFNGHPFSIPIVNPEVHARAASLGDVNSFVGSIHGRSGVDEGDMYSFRQSGGIGSYSGTPKSMTERFYMDELKEADETRAQERK